MTDRADFLRRAGAGAAGFSLAQLLGPAAALAGDGGGDFPAHPRWRFVFVSHDTLDPLFVATQFGAQDAALSSTARCSGPAPRAGASRRRVKALRSAISKKADGIAVSIVDEHGDRSGGGLGRAGGHPARRLQRRLGVERAPVRVRRREPACVGRQRRCRDRPARSDRHRRPLRAAAGEDVDGAASPGDPHRARGIAQGARGDRGPALGRRGQAAERGREGATPANAGSAGCSRSTASGRSRAGGRSRISACGRRASRAVATTFSRTISSSSPTGRSTSSSTSSRTSRGSRRCCSSSSRGSRRGSSSRGTRRPRCSCAGRTCGCSSRRRAASRAARAARRTRCGAPECGGAGSSSRSGRSRRRPRPPSSSGWPCSRPRSATATT